MYPPYSHFIHVPLHFSLVLYVPSPLTQHTPSHNIHPHTTHTLTVYYTPYLCMCRYMYSAVYSPLSCTLTQHTLTLHTSHIVLPTHAVYVTYLIIVSLYSPLSCTLTHTHTSHTLSHPTPSHIEQQLLTTQEELKETQDTVADLSRPPPEIPGADRQELLRLLDRRQHELSTLSEEWKNMASKLEVTSAAKSEFQSRCGLLLCVWVEGGEREGGWRGGRGEGRWVKEE